MSGPITATSNALSSATTVRAQILTTVQDATAAADASDASFPSTNLYNLRPSKVWKAGSADVLWAIDINYGAATTLDFAALINHENITQWRVYTSATGLASSWTERLDEDGPASVNSYGTWTETSAQYMRIALTVTASEIPKIGELIVDASTTLSRSFIWGATIGRQWASVTHRTQSGNVWSYDYGTDARSFALTWRGLTESEKDELDTLLTATKGAVYPFVMAPFPDATETGKTDEVYYVKAPESYSYVDVHVLSKEVAGLEFVELVRDVEVTS